MTDTSSRTGSDTWTAPQQDWAAIGSPYLVGQYEPVRDEREDRDLRVTGELPAGLAGSYLRNGGNPYFAPPGGYHVFDGDGMIHGVHLDGGGGARYSNRWVRSRGLAHEISRGEAVYGGLGEFRMPDAETIEAGGLLKNTANTNIVRHAGHYLALMEGARPTELSAELETLGEYDFAGRLDGAMTAHPKVDPDTGEMLFFGYSPFPPYLRYHVVSPTGELTHSTDVPIGRGVMIHDFVTTPDYAVFFDLPAIFDGEAMMAGEPAIRWKPEEGARIGVLPRGGDGRDTTWIDVDPFYVFHFMNAFERDGRIVVDGCRASAMPTSFGDDPVPEQGVRPYLWQWEIDPAGGTVTDRQLDDRTGDFPRINDAAHGKPYRFGYHAHTSSWDQGEGVWFDGVIQFDHATGASAEFVLEEGSVMGEVAFAADPTGSAENDGWLVAFASDLVRNTSEFLVIDARDVASGPVARVELPRRVPFGFHGNWMPTT